MELLLQSANLMSSFRQYQEPSLSACDASLDRIDLEAVLTDLQPVCNPAEAELVNLILNFFRSRKIYSAYRAAQTYSSGSGTKEHDPQQGQEPFPSTDHKQKFQNLMENDALQSMLSPTQKENLNQIGTLMQVLS
jgi:hypothetical protein